MTTPAYVFSNAAAHAVTHHRHLAAILDPSTRSRLSRLRRPLPGLRCLEVGAGAGSVARWLADQGARVVATDLHPMPIPPRQRLEVVANDITRQPVPEPPYDLIHARLVLVHLPQRHEVLRTLATALVPGGVLVIEDWDMTWTTNRVLRAPTATDQQRWTSFHDCLIRVFQSHGADPGWASAVYAAMVDADLTDVESQMHTRSWRGGEPGCLLVAGTTSQLREDLIRHGMTQEQLQRIRELMADPNMVIRMPPLVSTVGYKP
jgi:SAM-dependent methyltransferase